MDKLNQYINIIETKTIRKARRKQRPRAITTFTEAPVKRVTLNFLGREFKFFVKSSFTMTRDKFFHMLFEKVDCVKLEKDQIVFCTILKNGALEKHVAVNYKELKLKYIEMVNKILTKEYITGNGTIIDRVAIQKLMYICQCCYVRAPSDERRALVPREKHQPNKNMNPSHKHDLDYPTHEYVHNDKPDMDLKSAH